MLQMAGIDYEKADLSIRSLFSFQNHVATKTMVYIKERCRVDGVVILFTCNRTEVYISAEDKIDNLFDTICLVKNIDAEKYKSYAVERCDMDAVNHLFKLACGMKSKVFGRRPDYYTSKKCTSYGKRSKHYGQLFRKGVSDSFSCR